MANDAGEFAQDQAPRPAPTTAPLERLRSPMATGVTMGAVSPQGCPGRSSEPEPSSWRV